MRVINKFVTIIATAVLCTPWFLNFTFVNAQFGAPTVSPGQIQIIATPTQSNANEAVTLEARSYAVNLNAMDIIWYADDKIVTSGYGLYSTTVTLGAIGSETRLRVVGRMSGALVAEGFITLRPANLVLVMEANSTAPFWYQGRKLPSPRGSVSITAFPTLAGIYASLSPNRLQYTWHVNNSGAIALAGVGKQTLRLPLPKAPTAVTRVQVTVTDPRGTYSATGFVHVIPEKPHVTLFSDQSHSRTRNAVSGTIQLRPDEKIGLYAEPFYIGNSGDHTFEWKSNGQKIPITGERGNTAVLTMPSVPAAYTITASVLNIQNAFERAMATLILRVE
ncbi:MAG: hypothetical protein AAB343_00490 [Patescibacteria group bacterium]